MYTLYYSPGTASFAVHWMLNEINAPHELALIDFEAKQQKSAGYLQLNPGGMVPALIVDGVVRTECAALLMLLAERHPQASLAPAVGTPERAEYLQWMLFFANTLQPAFRAWFYADEPAGAANSEASKEQARLKIEGIWQRVDERLAGHSHLIGDQLSAVDFLATMLMRWSRNMPKPATEWRHIKDYVISMRARPAYLRTHQVEKLTDWVN